MADYNRAFENLLRYEGGYAPSDNRRGAVMMGITQKTLDGYWEQCPLVCQELGLPRKVEEINTEHARAFYRRFFWYHWLDQVKNQTLAELIFNLAVNMGPAWPLRFLSELGTGKPDEIALSGDPAALITGLRQKARDRYYKLARAHPRYADKVEGWENRLDAICGV